MFPSLESRVVYLGFELGCILWWVMCCRVAALAVCLDMFDNVCCTKKPYRSHDRPKREKQSELASRAFGACGRWWFCYIEKNRIWKLSTSNQLQSTTNPDNLTTSPPTFTFY